MRMPGSVKFLLSVVALSTAEPAIAQDQQRRGFIGLGMGPSVPLGGFADASSGSARAGRATPGTTNLLVSLGYRFREHLGVSASISNSEYEMRDSGGEEWWDVATFTAGPTYSLRLNARAWLDLKAMVGRIALTQVIDSYTFASGEGTGRGLGVDMRAAVRYGVFRRWAVFAEGGLQSASVTMSSGVRKDYQALISGLGIAFAW